MSAPVTEADLHAYVDEALPPARVAEIDAWLEVHPEEASRVAAYREQNLALRRAFDCILDEPMPRQLAQAGRPRRTFRHAAVIAWIALGGVAGWYLHAYTATQRAETSGWVRRAAMAHVVYSPEVRHAVEVGADQEAHLVRWLSKRVGSPLTVPHLGTLGYSLVGGRLLPGDAGPMAQFMYEDAKGTRLTLYVRANADPSRESAFRFAQEQGVGVFYWLDRKLAYALSGEISREELLRVADAVYRQLNP